MRMRKWLFLAGIVLAAVRLSAQPGKTGNRWAASLTGAILPMPAVNIGLQPGLLYRFSDQFSLLTEITLRLGKRADKDSEAVDKHYFRIQQEYRFHFGKKKGGRYYAGLRLAYSARRFADVTSGFYSSESPGSDKGFYYDKAKISSPVFSSSLQAGLLLKRKKRWTADLFGGIGARFVNTTYSDLVNAAPGIRARPSDKPVFYASYAYNGSAVWLHMNAGVRLLWFLSKE